jgi:flagellar motor switch protein FliG
MSVQAAVAGISNGLGISQAGLEREVFGNLNDAASEGKVATRRRVDPERLFGFETMTKMDDLTIRRMLVKVNNVDLIMALLKADKHTKDAVYRNLSAQSREHVEEKVGILENGDVRYFMTERSRNMISDAFLELMREDAGVLSTEK